MPDIAGARVSQRLQPVQDGLDRSIAKEVSNKLARDRKIAMQDEIDEHEMKESQKMLSEEKAKSWPGRPKLARSEVLERVGKLQREMAAKVAGSMEAIMTSLKSAQEDTSEANIPEDKKEDNNTLVDCVAADVKGFHDELSAMKDGLENLTLEGVLRDGEGDTDACKKLVLAECKDYRKKEVAAQKSIAAFRKAISDLAKTKFKKEGGDARPAFVNVMMAKVKTFPDARFNISKLIHVEFAGQRRCLRRPPVKVWLPSRLRSRAIS